MKTEFNEKQKFTQWWIWTLIIGIILYVIYGYYKEMRANAQLTQQSYYQLLLYSLFMCGILLLFWLMQLKTNINDESISLHFFPFTRKSVDWDEVKKVRIIDYGFVGGWGIRFWTKYGTVYNTKGRIGLAIELKNGKKFLIGTQKQEELKTVLQNIKPEILSKVEIP